MHYATTENIHTTYAEKPRQKVSFFRKVRHAVHSLETRWDHVRLSFKHRFNLMDPVIIFPYRGLGNNREVYIKGRIQENEGLAVEKREDMTVWENIRLMYRRYESDEIPYLPIKGTFYGETIETRADDEGYFEMHFKPGKDLVDPNTEWHHVDLHCPAHKYTLDKDLHARAHVLIPNEKAAFGVISDVDDTILKSNITNFFGKIKTLLMNDAKSRVAFPGIAAFYRELRKGTSNEEVNPIYYVSGSSYNIYDLLDRFCEVKEIPKGPFMLRELGYTRDQVFMQDTLGYKVSMIQRVLSYYPDLSFVMVGDSGQKDPEIYRKIVKQYPGKIKAIYIRNIDQSEQRQSEITAIARELHGWGVPMLLIDSTKEAARHAAELGLITEEGKQNVIDDADKDLREEAQANAN
ncbi:App1 family protein [Roseivirga sp. BDSF3-8]|uniref:App1 family protein n=1 Tax=Roseivirga sp. BDSF3-8 TaxID=3241598 RepID=UPI00353202BE